MLVVTDGEVDLGVDVMTGVGVLLVVMMTVALTTWTRMCVVRV